jgi:hypothetical membrane protein
MPARALLIGGVVGPVLFLLVFLVEGALRPGYDPMRHQVSLLSLGDRGWIQVLSFLICGSLIAGFGMGLWSVLEPGRAAIGGPIGIVLAGIGLIVAGAFSVQPSFGYPPGAPSGIPDPDLASYLHVVGAFLFFFGMIAAAALFAGRFHTAGRRGWAWYSGLSAAIVLVFFAASSGGPDGQPLVPDYVGLLQRVSIIVGLVWLAALAASFIRDGAAAKRLSPASS